MGNTETLILDRGAVEANAQLSEVIEAVEDAFAAYERGNAQMPAKSYVDLPQYNGDFRSMPAYLDVRGDDSPASRRDSDESRAAGEWDAAGVKWVNVHPDNPIEYDLPTVIGTMIYSDPRNAYPLALMDATELTLKRTGAAAAVATKHLAREDARSLGLVGAGVQSHSQLEAISIVRPIEEVVVCDRDEEIAAAFVDSFSDRYDIREGSIEEAAACDVLSTVTPSREPIVPHEALGERTHVNAMGADAPEKQELDPAIFDDARVVIDDYDQTTHSGEISIAFEDGRLAAEDLTALGEIITGERDGRPEGTGVTVFDSTGLAIQDVASAHVVYEHARERGDGVAIDLLGGIE